jgi:hypothetical protein
MYNNTESMKNQFDESRYPIANFRSAKFGRERMSLTPKYADGECGRDSRANIIGQQIQVFRVEVDAPAGGGGGRLPKTCGKVTAPPKKFSSTSIQVFDV